MRKKVVKIVSPDKRGRITIPLTFRDIFGIDSNTKFKLEANDEFKISMIAK